MRALFAMRFLGDQGKPTGLLDPRLRNKRVHDSAKGVRRPVRSTGLPVRNVRDTPHTDAARRLRLSDDAARAMLHADFRGCSVDVATRTRRPSLALADLEEPALTRSIYLLPILSIERPSTDIGKLLKGRMSSRGCVCLERVRATDIFRNRSSGARINFLLASKSSWKESGQILLFTSFTRV